MSQAERLTDTDPLLLAEMRAAAAKIQAYTAGMAEAEFLAGGLTADAVSLNLLLIGEGAVQLTEATRRLESEIPWRDLIELRHRTAHGLARIDLRIVWRIVQDDLPPLIERLERLSGKI